MQELSSGIPGNDMAQEWSCWGEATPSVAGLSIRQLKVGPVYRIKPVERYDNPSNSGYRLLLI